MATKATDAQHDEILANIERVRSLAEAENFDGMGDIIGETTALIKGIKGTGSKALKEEFTKALLDAEQAKPGAEVDKVHEGTIALETQDYTIVPGVSELINRGAKDLAEGVKLHLKAADTARHTAEVLLEMRLKMNDKHGAPDLAAKSHASKQAAQAMYDEVRQANDLEDTFANRDAVKKLMRSVQYQMSQVVVDYVRSLDSNPDEAAKFRQATEAFSDATPSEAVFSFYNINRQSQAEIAAQREADKRALAEGARAAIESGNGNGEGDEGGEGEGDEGNGDTASVDPDTYAMAVTSKLDKATRGINIELVAAASDDVKGDVREHLENQLAALKTLIAATL